MGERWRRPHPRNGEDGHPGLARQHHPPATSAGSLVRQSARTDRRDAARPVLESRVDDVDGTADELTKQHFGKLKHLYKAALKGFSTEMSDKEAAKLAADPRVQYVEEDSVVTIDTTQTGATWGLDRIDQRNLPLDGNYTYNTTASNVHAYIVDPR